MDFNDAVSRCAREVIKRCPELINNRVGAEGTCSNIVQDWINDGTDVKKLRLDRIADEICDELRVEQEERRTAPAEEFASTRNRLFFAWDTLREEVSHTIHVGTEALTEVAHIGPGWIQAHFPLTLSIVGVLFFGRTLIRVPVSQFMIDPLSSSNGTPPLEI